MDKKVYLVSKTHLDLGFTDLAENIKKRYINEFIPNAVKAARALNADKKRFVWTTGSWILKEALMHGTKEERDALSEAMERGDIVSHALPFTTHTELLDKDTFLYGLGIVKELDKRFNRKTIAAKMTDVPGHTAAIVPLLYQNGIKLLHIGVNEASALPKVPATFLWRYAGGEVVVVYEGSYGGVYKNEYIDDILYFAHTSDNKGPVSYEKALENYQKLEREYPDYEIVASGLDEIAEKFWAVRDKLPVITSEIGDSWIHGASSDPFKAGALRELIALKNKWLADGSLDRNSGEYENLADNILCLAEHTCGRDVKRYLSDYSHYLKKDFKKAKEKDRVKLNFFELFKGIPHNLQTAYFRYKKEYHKGSYKAMESSWAEQREYIEKALVNLTPEHKREAEARLIGLRPAEPAKARGEKLVFCKRYAVKDASIVIDKSGSAGLYYKDKEIFKPKNSLIDYISYGVKDYGFWLKNYTRDLKKNFSWAVADFARPVLERAEGKYKEGRFSYRAYDAYIEKNKDSAIITVFLKTDADLVKDLGAPETFEVTYTLENNKLTIDVKWFNKDENRLTEGLFLRLYPAVDDGSLTYSKLGEKINPLNITENGNRHLSAVESVSFSASGLSVEIFNRHCPLVSLGAGKILRFDNKYEDYAENGIAYVLYNNVWGTNFPLWYKDNAAFTTEILIKEEINKKQTTIL